ncbi:MAG: hypothetical protein AB1568_16580 [Thermodesulfobacteriota bacterium]
MSVDWAAIRAEYEGESGVSVRQIAKAHGVGHPAILKKAAKEGWKRPATGGAAAPAGNEQGAMGDEHGAAVDQASVADKRQGPVTVEAGGHGAATMETEPAEIRAARHDLEEATAGIHRLRAALADLEGREMATRARLREIPGEVTAAWVSALLDAGDKAGIVALRLEGAALGATLAELPAARAILERRIAEAGRRCGQAQAGIDSYESLQRYEDQVASLAQRGTEMNGGEVRELTALGGPLGKRREIDALDMALRHHSGTPPYGLGRRGEPMEWPAVAGGR